MTDMHMDRLMELPGFSELSEDARKLARNADMAMADWHNRGEASYDYLWAACQVLIGWESPEWGNTGGRYGFSLGMMDQLDAEWLAGLSEGEFEAWCDENEDWSRDFLGEPWAAYVFSKYTEENRNGYRDLLELADWLSANISAQKAEDGE